MHDYDDIINLPHHVSKKHPQMPLIERAAQFSPFAALIGYDKAIKETARFTEARIILDEEAKEIIDRKITTLFSIIETHPSIKATYFVSDLQKDGGVYITKEGRAMQIDKTRMALLLDDGTSIPLNDIVSLDGLCFF